MNTIEADLELMRHCVGIFTGMLTDEEHAAFQRLIEANWACRDYQGAASFLGLAKVRLFTQSEHDLRANRR